MDLTHASHSGGRANKKYPKFGQHCRVGEAGSWISYIYLIVAPKRSLLPMFAKIQRAPERNFAQGLFTLSSSLDLSTHYYLQVVDRQKIVEHKFCSVKYFGVPIERPW